MRASPAASSPPMTVAQGRIAGGTALGSAPYLHALDTATGHLVWQQGSARITYAAPASAGSSTGGVVFLGDSEGTLHALDLATGKVL
jgi:outer membrane protein assembly factor BamB